MGGVMVHSVRLERYLAPLREVLTRPEERTLPLLKFGMFLVILFCILSVLIFNLRHYVTRILNSDEICSNQFLYDVMSWILPKAASHCDMMLTTLSLNPYKGIAVVLDFWIFLYF